LRFRLDTQHPPKQVVLINPSPESFMKFATLIDVNPIGVVPVGGGG
jgi:hypothetical protein